MLAEQQFIIHGVKSTATILTLQQAFGEETTNQYSIFLINIISLKCLKLKISIYADM